jgi:transposase-like protein
MLRRRRKARNPSFATRWFSDDVIVRCVSSYPRFKLSYRDLVQIMGELGICVAACTICVG